MDSMDQIYQNHARMIYAWLLTRTRNPDLAEELCQETFYQALRTLDRYQESSSLSSWLFGIAKNVLFTWRRQNPEYNDLDESLPVQNRTVPSAEDNALAQQAQEDFIELLADLPDSYRQVVWLRIQMEFSFEEIGQQLGKTENWARVTFYRAKQSLKKKMNPED